MGAGWGEAEGQASEGKAEPSPRRALRDKKPWASFGFLRDRPFQTHPLHNMTCRTPPRAPLRVFCTPPPGRLQISGGAGSPVSRKNFFRLTGILRAQKTIFQSTGIPVSRKKFFRLTGILCSNHFSYFCGPTNALLGPTPPGFAHKCKSPTRTHPATIFRKCRNTTETLQMPYSDPPRQDLGEQQRWPLPNHRHSMFDRAGELCNCVQHVRKGQYRSTPSKISMAWQMSVVGVVAGNWGGAIYKGTPSTG